jgi:hypothetical protein
MSSCPTYSRGQQDWEWKTEADLTGGLHFSMTDEVSPSEMGAQRHWEEW